MRVVFIFIVLLLLLGIAVPIGIAAKLWMDAGAVVARAERDGELRATPAGAPLTTVERTIAMYEFRDTWRSRALPCRTLFSLWNEIATEQPSSGLSVSQKLAATVPADQPRSIRWQVRSLLVACQLEQRFDDRQILRMWLARANFGRDAIGIENAAQTIFGKPSRSLSVEEAARLTALLRAPSLRTQPERWAERGRLIEDRVSVRTP